MKEYLKQLWVLLALFSGSVWAMPIPLTSCDVSSVTLDSVVKSDGGATNLLLGAPYNASACLFFDGENDDAMGLSDPSVNIGIKNDGLLNGEGGILGGDPELWFITADELQDLGELDPLSIGPDGANDDPGWIHLVHYDNDDYDKIADDERLTYDNAGEGVPDFDGFVPSDANPYSIDHLLDFSIECATGDDAPDCTEATWTLTTEPNIIELVEELLGPSQFDHLAFSIKAGNGFIVYDFDFIDIFGEEINSLGNTELDFATPYILSGTLSTADFLNGQGNSKNISHLNVWARDPETRSRTSVPEPSTLMLFALSLFAMVAFRKRSVAVS